MHLFTRVTALREAPNSVPDILEKLVFYFDGEKDPRNLMIVFSVLLVPMAEWDISAHAQVSFRKELCETVIR